MIKLKSIKITGFKEKGRIVDLKFSDEPATVIYGENGSGKTTLLRIIHAVFTKNSQYLFEQNVRGIELIYFDTTDKKENCLKITVEKDKRTDWGGISSARFTHSTSILFGVNRGLAQSIVDFIADKSLNSMYHQSVTSVLNSKMESFATMHHISPPKFFESAEHIEDTKGTDFLRADWYKKKHIIADFLSIYELEKIITNEFSKGTDAISEKVKNAFFNAISNVLDIELEKESYNLPDNFKERIEAKKDVLIDLIEGLDESSLQKKLLDYLHNKKTNSNIQDSKIFRALLLNILEKAEEENIELKAVNVLMEIFNNHLYRNKKLIVTEDEAYIQFVNGQLGPRHSLEKLSSGERHLLTFLTLFLIIGRGRDFFLIDEPEISMNMKWQRKLLPLLSELSPNSQIIVATHSPDIASRNSNYLVELV